MTSVELKKVFPNKKVKAIIACMTSLLLSVQLYFVKGCVFCMILFQIKKITETSLSANQERTEMERKRLVWKVEGPSEEEESKVVRGGPVDPAKLVVNLAPMEIRTFIIEFS